MNWSLLLLLACPLMMLFCMKGMFGGDKKAEAKKAAAANAQAEQAQTSLQEVQSMQIKMAEMMEQNHKLMQEMQEMKEQQKKQDQQNVQTAQEPESDATIEKESSSSVVVNINNKPEEVEPKRKTS
jgi:regulator of replication initiation timing